MGNSKLTISAMATLIFFTCTGAIADQISIIDQRDRTVTLDSEAKRVVTIPIPAASMFILVDGGTDRLVGMHQLSKTAIKDRILQRFYPNALAIPSNITGKGFSFVPNVEELLALEPDLVFQWGHLNDDIIDPLVNAGPVSYTHLTLPTILLV